MQPSPPDTALHTDETARLRERVAELERALSFSQGSEHSRNGLAFLAEASAVLASSLDYEETLAHLAQIAVPHIADWCAIDLRVRGGSIERLAVAHIDPNRIELAHELSRRWPIHPDDPTGVPNVLRTGRSEFVPTITEQMVRDGISDPELRDAFLAVGLSSLMIVPLKARDRTLGAITLATAESGRHFTQSDLHLAEDVAHRAAVAIDNAKLYRDLRQFRATLDRTSDCVFMFDAETLRFFYVNQGAVDQVGYSVDELKAMTPLDIKPTFTLEAFQAMIAPLLAGEVSVYNFETVHRHKDGHDVPVEIALQYVDPPEGDPRFVAIVRDITERKRVEQELADQAATLASQKRLIDLAHEAIIVRDSTGRILSWNRGAEELYGYSAEEAVGQTSHELLRTHLPDGEGDLDGYQDRTLQRGGAWEGELVHTRRDGQQIVVESRQAAVADGYGQPAQVLEINRDVTARKQAEAVLRENERRFRDLADAMPLLVWFADARGETSYYSRRMIEYTGRTVEQVGEWGWTDMIHPDDIERTVQNWQRALATEQIFEVEYRFKRHDGSYRWQLVRAQPVRNATGSIEYWVGTNTDIDEQKRVEAALRASEERFRELADAMPMVVWRATSDGTIDYYSQRWFDYTGLTLEETYGWGWDVVIHPDDMPRTLEAWTTALKTGEQYEVEYRWKQGKDGSYRWWLGRALPVRDDTGAISYWVGTGADIDEQKRAEDQLREQASNLARLTQQLEDRNRELDQFAYITSHDLKAPLRGMANLAQWIEEDLGEGVTPDIKQQFDLLRGRAHRMEALIDGILQYSRVGRMGEDPQPVDVNTMLNEVIDLLAPPPGTVTVEGDMPTLTTARVPLQQVFHNLIGNALKHGGPGVRVRVSAAEQNGSYAFTVSDSGPGIAPQYHERIFGIFQTLASRDKVEGSGLGLALVKKIVEHRGGRVTLDSDEGRGASFTFTWPRETAKGQKRR